ncbi:Sensor protein qseC [uncultured Avibacterium sp.]|uniref:histidine kinase n=1 Tax=uncultured Avibacterium sp. TaxID=1936169 RepID=A0A486XCI3_9PAST|nr:Sensor protein qseC [uncultured Avibacterium sp.]
MRSLKGRLSLILIAMAALVAVLGSGWAFYDTYYETHKLQDDMLKQISAYITPQSANQQGSDSPNDAGIEVYFIDKTQRTSALTLPKELRDDFYAFKRKNGRYTPLENKKANKFSYDLKNAGELYRGYVRVVPQGVIVVLQKNEYREDLASRAAWTNFLPLLLLLPLMAGLIYGVVQWTTAPIARLSRQLSARQPEDLTPLPTNALPSEIIGFVAAINQLLGQTEAFIQQQKRFIADASHELRSPLTVISLQAERLSQQSFAPELQSQLVQLNQSIQRARHLLDQLLSLARMQNVQKNDRTYFALQPLFRQVITDVYPLAEQKSQDLGVTSETEVQCYGNETDLYLLLKTLLDNAIRYTPAGSQIDLWAEEHPHEIILNVEDNGQGIAPEERQRVFDPFYRILGTGQTGSGLGLAIAQRIVANYGGAIELLDSPHFPHGLWVKISLPKK